MPGFKPSDTERKRRAMQIARAICVEEKPPALVVERNLSCERCVLRALRASLRALPMPRGQRSGEEAHEPPDRGAR